MCNPIILAGAAGMQAVSQITQGQSVRDAANMDADRLEWEAGQIRMDAQADAREIARQGRAQRGALVSAVAGSGVKIGEGSAGLAEAEVVENAYTDEYMAILNGERRARGMQMEADSRRRAGRDARRAANIGAFTTLLQAGAMGMQAGGWRSNGPGFAGTQAAAPVSSAQIRWVR
jgi:hypothetical protein